MCFGVVSGIVASMEVIAGVCDRVEVSWRVVKIMKSGLSRRGSREVVQGVIVGSSAGALCAPCRCFGASRVVRELGSTG